MYTLNKLLVQKLTLECKKEKTYHSTYEQINKLNAAQRASALVFSS